VHFTIVHANGRFIVKAASIRLGFKCTPAYFY